MINVLKTIVSYIWPITKKIPSEINGDLELTWYQGKKVLDTKNANFSYGSLDVILDEAFNHLKIHDTDKVLILGLGGGNFIRKIQKKNQHQGEITAVELDAQIIKIAKEEFAISSNNKTTILHQDALQFIWNTNETYDFIFIDIFVDNIVPDSFYEIHFWNKIVSILKPKGRFLFNGGITQQDGKKINPIINNLSTDLKVFKKEKVNKTNTLLFGIKP